MEIILPLMLKNGNHGWSWRSLIVSEIKSNYDH